MKGKDFLIIGGIGLVAYLFYKMQKSSAYSPSVFSEFPYVIDSLKAGSTSTPYKTAVDKFANTPINTPASITAGIDVINTAAKENIMLPRLSQTIKNVGYNSNVARLADGSVKVVTVKESARDSAGMTAIDKLIAKNKAVSKK